MIPENWDVCRLRFDCTEQVYMYLKLSAMLIKSNELLRHVGLAPYWHSNCILGQDFTFFLYKM